MKIQKNKGLSLVELMLVAAGLAGLSVVGMQMMKTQTRSITKTTFDSDVNLITNEIIAILSDPNKCFATLGNKNAVSTTSGIFSINNKFLSTESGSLNAYGNANIQIDSYSLNATTAEVTANNSFLNINFHNKMLLKGSLGPTSVVKKISLYVEVDGSNNILKCRSLSSSSSDIWSRGNSSDIYYSGGNVGIGTNSPMTGLDVAGGIRSGNETDVTVCDSNTEGTERYNRSLHRHEYCSYQAGPPISYSWKPLMSSSGSSKMFTVWGDNNCPSGYVALHSGKSFTSAINGSGNPGSDIICNSGTQRKLYRVNNTLSGYLWDNPMDCAICAENGIKTCFTKYGSNSCPTGFTAAYTGHIFQTAWASSGTSGKFVCRKGVATGGLFIINATSSGYEWIYGDACAECCSDN